MIKFLRRLVSGALTTADEVASLKVEVVRLQAELYDKSQVITINALHIKDYVQLKRDHVALQHKFDTLVKSCKRNSDSRIQVMIKRRGDSIVMEWKS